MFEDHPVAASAAGDEWVAALGRLVGDLATLGDGPGGDVFVIDAISGPERVKAAAAAAQARLTERLDMMRRAEHLATGLGEDQAGRGVAQEVASARRESPHHARRHLTLARALVHDLPQTLAALGRGDINEHRAEIIAHETRVLCAEDRRTVDATLTHQLSELGDKALLWATRRLSFELDEHATLKRMAKARTERRVTSRPVADGMTLISAVVPAPEGTAVMLALTGHAALPHTEDDTRTRTQRVADTFCQRLVGLSNTLSSTLTSTLNVEVQLVMTAEMLLGDHTGSGSGRAAHLRGHGPLPSPTARDLIATTQGRVLIRRLYAKQTPGWTHHTTHTWPHPHHIDITTPTRHRHTSPAPPLPVRITADIGA